MMQNLSDHIESGNWGQFYSDEEIGHALTFIYNLLLWIERDEADQLELKADQFIWIRDGVIVGTFPIKIPQPQPSFKEHLDLVIQRDPIVHERLRPAADNPSVYKLKHK